MPPTTAASGSYTRFSSKLTSSLNQVSKAIEENAKTIDAIQDVALELTNSISALHALVVKYVGVANGVLDTLLPILRGLPVVPKNVMNLLTNLESITQKIIDTQASVGKTIMDVQTGLRTGDVSKLQTHAGDLKKLTQALSAILPKK